MDADVITQKPVTKEDFDVESVYDEKIFPLMKEILEICKTCKLPMFATFLFARSESGKPGEDLQFCTSIVNRPPERGEQILQRLLSIIQNGLPEDRPAAFTITTRAK